MSDRYFRVKKDNFLWCAGAIVEKKEGEKGYNPVDNTSIWDTTDQNGTEYISSKIVENNPEWFEEVYKINLVTRFVYKVKAEAQEMMSKEFS